MVLFVKSVKVRRVLSADIAQNIAKGKNKMIDYDTLEDNYNEYSALISYLVRQDIKEKELKREGK